MATAASEKRISEHVMLSPHGKVIRIPDVVFDAIVEFMERKFTGELSIQFRDGGIAGVGCNSKRPLRPGNAIGNGKHV